jgi:hypothetical protein
MMFGSLRTNVLGAAVLHLASPPLKMNVELPSRVKLHRRLLDDAGIGCRQPTCRRPYHEARG